MMTGCFSLSSDANFMHISYLFSSLKPAACTTSNATDAIVNLVCAAMRVRRTFTSKPFGLDLKLQQISVSRLGIDQLSICPGKKKKYIGN